jgi:hypothetical protein
MPPRIALTLSKTARELDRKGSKTIKPNKDQFFTTTCPRDQRGAMKINFHNVFAKLNHNLLSHRNLIN